MLITTDSIYLHVIRFWQPTRSQYGNRNNHNMPIVTITTCLPTRSQQPTHEQQYPNNLNINPKEFEMEDSLDFYTDGSCKPNPGPGGAAFYSPNFAIKRKIYIVDHDTTINYCELYAIKMVIASMIRYINYCENKKYEQCIKSINILTDSQFVCDILSKNGYPKYDYYYKLIQVIFELMKILENNNICINIFKLESHCGIEGNENADKLAKAAASIAKQCKYGQDNTIKYDMSKNPVGIDIAKDLIRLRIIRKNERRDEWIKIKNNRKILDYDGKQRFKGEGILQQTIINDEYYVKNRNNEMKNELMYLTKKECEVIMKLRTEYINLNNYRRYIGKHETGLCNHCNVKETVSHFLIDCTGFRDDRIIGLNSNNQNYEILRNKLFKRLRQVTIFFKYYENINAKNFLFPHTWQLKPYSNNQDYKLIVEKNLKQRIQILKLVAKFVFETKRFNTDIGI